LGSSDKYGFEARDLVPASALGGSHTNETGRKGAGGRGENGKFGGDDEFAIIDADYHVLWFQNYRLEIFIWLFEVARGS
jgi:hypothetical protein